MYLIKDHFAGPQAVPTLRIVGVALHDALVFPPLDDLLGVVIVPVQFLLPLGSFQHLHQIQLGPLGLVLVVGAHVHIVVGHRIVRRDGAGTVKGNKPVFSGAPSHQCKNRLPPGPLAFSPVGAIP